MLADQKLIGVIARQFDILKAIEGPVKVFPEIESCSRGRDSSEGSSSLPASG